MAKLDTLKLRVELAKIDKNYAWLARQIGYTRAYISYIVKNESLMHIEKIASTLGLKTKDLIK